MIYIILSLLLSYTSYSQDLSQYNNTINTVLDAAYKQSGLQYKAIQIKDATTNDVKKWSKRNDLVVVTSVFIFLAPIAISHRLKFQIKNFQFYGDKKIGRAHV